MTTSNFNVQMRNEDYSRADRNGEGGNLTELQRDYLRWWREAKEIQCGQRKVQSACIGFGPAEGHAELGHEIRDINSVCLMSLYALPRPTIPSGIRGGRYRFHYMEQAGRIEDDQLVFGGEFRDGGRLDPHRIQQADFTKRPLQDHQMYLACKYSPHSVGGLITEALVESGAAESPQLTLRSPIYGRYAVVRDDLHIRLTVDGVDVFRFNLEDEAAIEFLPVGSQVSLNAPLVRLVSEVEYLAAEPWASQPGLRTPRPHMDRIMGDLLSATRQEFQLEFCLNAAFQMTGYAMGDKAHLPVSLGAWFPAELVEIPLSAWDNRRSDGWKSTVDLQQQVLHAVSPDGALEDNGCTIVAPFDGELISVEDRFGYKIVSFRDPEGVQHRVSLPACAVIDNREPRPVDEGEYLGDVIPRAYYENYAQLTEAAAGCITKIEDAVFTALSIFSGEPDSGWRGEGVLVDKRLCHTLLESATMGVYLDFRACEPAVYTGGVVVGPIFQWEPGFGFESQVNGVRLDTTPVGKFADGVLDLVPTTMSRRRGRRRSGK